MSTAIDPVAALNVRSAMQSITDSQGRSIYRLLESQARRSPEAIAIAAPGRAPLTYSQLVNQVEDVARTLNSMGVGRNDRVAVVLPNGPEMAVAFLAVAAGATCAPLNPTYKAGELDFYLTDLNAKALIVQSGMDSPAITVAQKRGIPVIKLSPVPEAEAGVFRLTNEERSDRTYGGLARPPDVALMLHTSGTTAKPKLVPLTQANMCISAHNIVAALRLNSSDCCLNVMPLFHIHGLMVVLSSLAAGGRVICPSNPDLSEFFKWVEEFRPTWYTASPTIHQAVLVQAKQNHDIIIRRPLRFIRSASSPLPPKIMVELENVFHAPVIEAYAMTEASHQMSSNPLPPGNRKAGSVGVAAGPEVGITDESGNFLPRNKTGEIVIRGANVMGGYENNPAANAASFTRGWFRTGDVGHMDAEGYLFITGRIKEIINRGGEKISPREVDEVLLEHPAVSEVVTFAVPHVTLGEDVAAAVVLRDNASVTEREIQDFAATRLAEFKVPRQVQIVSKLPKSATGKLQRVGLAEKLGLVAPLQAASEKGAAPRAPRTRVEEKLVKILAKVLGLAMIGIDDNFFDLGGHSLLALQVIAQIENVFGKRLPPPALLQAPTVGQLAALLGQEKWPETLSSLVPVQPNGSKLPFFWIHGDSSNAFLPRYLGPDQPVYGLVHQSQDGKPAFYTEVETIAAHYLEEIRAVQPKGPYSLGGFSFGGTVAFEMAQRLKRTGEEVVLLFLLDPYFPGDGIPKSPNKSTNVSFREELKRHLCNLAPLGAQQKLAYILVRVRDKIAEKITNRTARISKTFKRAVCKLYFAMGHSIPLRLRSFYILDIYREARRYYRPQLYSGTLVYIKSDEHPGDDLLNWGRVIAGGLEVHEIPGDHETLIERPFVGPWAEKLKDALQRAQTTCPRKIGEENERQLRSCS